MRYYITYRVRLTGIQEVRVHKLEDRECPEDLYAGVFDPEVVNAWAAEHVDSVWATRDEVITDLQGFDKGWMAAVKWMKSL